MPIYKIIQNLHAPSLLIISFLLLLVAQNFWQMKSASLCLMKITPPATKHLPIELVPHPQITQRVPVWKRMGAVSAASKNRRKRLQVMESPEKVVMAAELERELEQEGCWAWREMEKCKGCEENVGMAELMECLEREAIMGEDEGKEPNDYNRRAQIFDKSSKIFQGLNQLHHHTNPVSSS